MFTGPNKISVDSKGRLAIPSCYREFILVQFENRLTITLSPFDRALWLYPRPEWDKIKSKLSALADSDKQSRRDKQMIRGYARDCEPDGQGRILIPRLLRDYAGLAGPAMIFGQDNKFEIWNEAAWDKEFAEWQQSIGDDSGSVPEALRSISF